MHEKKIRLDQLMAQSGLAATRSLAQRLILAGQVTVNGQQVTRTAETVAPDAKVELVAGPRFVSRGGEKLAAAVEEFSLLLGGLVCADVGASTGGFTDCLLQHGAARVYAIDVGKGILDWKLRNDPRVIVMEKTNARFLEQLPEQADFVTIDASFISLGVLLPVVRGWLKKEGVIVALVKPQFEAGKGQVGKGGVVRDPEIHRRILLEVIARAAHLDLHPAGLIKSPLKGPAGNIEFLIMLKYQPSKKTPEDWIRSVVTVQEAGLDPDNPAKAEDQKEG